MPLLSERISQQYPKYKVVNASISGDTTSGGVARLPALLRQHAPAVVVLELGSNELRGLSLTMTEQNLRNMAQAARQADADVVIVGMQIPPNYGRDYAALRAAVPHGGQGRKSPARPFLMEGIATNRAMFQADGIHPNEDAQPQLLDNVWPALRTAQQGSARRGGLLALMASAEAGSTCTLYCSRSMRTTASFSAWP